VNIRPVRFAPLAAGANPTMSRRGYRSPHPGIGLPRYGWSANERRFSRATSSRHFTSRGHARHTEMRAPSSPSDKFGAASVFTSAAVRAIGVVAEATSSGHPVPGGTGEKNSWPVTGCGSDCGVAIEAPPPFGRPIPVQTH
jgi:hypothetical protein